MKIRIGKKEISDHSPAFIIAELSANHNQRFDIAVRTIRAAKKAGADAVKLQTYTADTITMKSDTKYFRINSDTIWDGRTLYDLYQEAHTPWQWQPKLKKLANQLGMECFSSPFDITAVDFLKKMNVPAYKIASFEITDIPLIEYTAAQGKPMIISTGIATVADITAAVRACRRKGNYAIALLQCTSAYPAPLAEANLATMPDMKKRFRVITGLSDHTTGIVAPIAAVSLGAKIIEKHLILKRSLGGPDASFSLEPDEFRNMVRSVRDAEQAIGKIRYTLSEKTKKSRLFSRSLFAVKDIRAGDRFTYENVRSIRPNAGLPPILLPTILRKKARRSLKAGTPLRRTDISR
ncbi:MAG: pseudaminic acid synthase [Patescibacteria group bacterium]